MALPTPSMQLTGPKHELLPVGSSHLDFFYSFGAYEPFRWPSHCFTKNSPAVLPLAI